MKIILIIGVVCLMAVVVLLATRRSGAAVSSLVREFVSMTCEKGDITLTLHNDHRFTLTLKHWDSKTNTHTGTDLLTGDWREDGENLLLTAQGNRLNYKQEETTLTIGSKTATVAGYAWVSSSKQTPFDTYPVVEKERTDAALLEAMKK